MEVDQTGTRSFEEAMKEKGEGGVRTQNIEHGTWNIEQRTRDIEVEEEVEKAQVNMGGGEGGIACAEIDWGRT